MHAYIFPFVGKQVMPTTGNAHAVCIMTLQIFSTVSAVFLVNLWGWWKHQQVWAGGREKGFHRSQPHQEHCHQDRRETAAACHVFLAFAKGNVRQTCRHCHLLSFFSPYQLIETLQLPIFFQMVPKNLHAVYLTFIGSSANLLVRRFCLASSEKCDLPILAFFTAIGREFHIFSDCDQIC